MLPPCPQSPQHCGRGWSRGYPKVSGGSGCGRTCRNNGSIPQIWLRSPHLSELDSADFLRRDIDTAACPYHQHLALQVSGRRVLKYLVAWGGCESAPAQPRVNFLALGNCALVDCTTSCIHDVSIRKPPGFCTISHGPLQIPKKNSLRSRWVAFHPSVFFLVTRRRSSRNEILPIWRPMRNVECSISKMMMAAVFTVRVSRMAMMR